MRRKHPNENFEETAVSGPTTSNYFLLDIEDFDGRFFFAGKVEI